MDGAYEASVYGVIHRPVRDDWFETDENSTNQSFNVTANDVYYPDFSIMSCATSSIA